MGLNDMMGKAFGGSLLGKTGFFDSSTETIDPYAKLREKWQPYMIDRLGKQTPYSLNPSFGLQQPKVEKELESQILGRLKEPKSFAGDYNSATEKYSNARKASMEETFAKEKEQTRAMYNRLGLASSTPGLQAIGDVSRRQATEANLLDSELQYQNLDRTLQAMELGEQAYQSILGQAQTLGGAQREYQQWQHQISLEDLQRMLNEEYQYASLAGNVLGSNAPQYYYNPSAFEELLQIGTQLGSAALTGGA